MRKIYIALLGLLFMGSAVAGSTINPSIPAQNSALTSAPLRANFMAAYTDINGILGQFAGTTAPPGPSRYQYWLDTTSNPATLKIYDGLSWVATAKLNTTTHAWSSVGSYVGTPIATTYGGTGADLHAATGAVSMSSGVTSVGTLPLAYLAAPLASLGAYNTSGLLTQTAANTFTGRTLTGTTAEITVTNGNGVSGNPTVSLPSALTFTGKTVTDGTFASPTLITPALGAATATTINGNTITTGTGTLTLGAGKTHTVNNSIALSGTDGTTMLFPTTSATIARTDAAQTFTGAQIFSSTIVGSVSGNAATVTTNANLTGPITSVGNATSVASQTGTGSTFVMSASPTLTGTPNIAAATATSITFGTTALAMYEEGACTPGFAFGGGATGITYSSQLCRYTVIGNRVFVNGRIILSSKGSSTGAVSITGMPYAMMTLTNLLSACSIQFGSVASSLLTPTATIGSGATTLTVNQLVSGTRTALIDTDFTNTTFTDFSCQYPK